MPQDEQPKSARASQISPHALFLGFLVFGLVISFATNMSQDRKIESLAKEVDSLRQQNERQIGELRAAQSAALDQTVQRVNDLQRLNQLATQMQKPSPFQPPVLERPPTPAAPANANKPKIAVAEPKRPDIVPAATDRRVSLSSDARVQVLQRPTTPTSRAGAELDFSDGSGTEKPAPSPSLPAVAESKANDEQAAAPAPAHKRSFWHKLNPFGRHSHSSDPEN
jgi:hypothetical protein